MGGYSFGTTIFSGGNKFFLPGRTLHCQPCFLHCFSIDVYLSFGSLGQKLPEIDKTLKILNGFQSWNNLRFYGSQRTDGVKRSRESVDICILLLLINLLDFFLDLGLAPRTSLQFLNRQPESQVFVWVFLLHVSQQFLKAWKCSLKKTRRSILGSVCPTK